VFSRTIAENAVVAVAMQAKFASTALLVSMTSILRALTPFALLRRANRTPAAVLPIHPSASAFPLANVRSTLPLARRSVYAELGMMGNTVECARKDTQASPTAGPQILALHAFTELATLPHKFAIAMITGRAQLVPPAPQITPVRIAMKANRGLLL